MRISDISVPEIYTSSADFRFFLRWIEESLTKVHYDTENFLDLYDPERCPAWLLWMLADTMGFKYDDRLPVAFNRFVLLYFMSMIRNRGSKDGVTLAAEANLKQFDIEQVAGIGYEDATGEFVEPKEILFNRLEDTSIPVNSAYVTPHTAEGYIDVVYFSDRVPIDACIEYVRPLGMYCFQSAGVRMDARTKISVDARLTNNNDVGLSIGPTHVGHYSRDDYARLQRLDWEDLEAGPNETRNRLNVRDGINQPWNDSRTERQSVDKLSDTRRDVWYRNSTYEDSESVHYDINPGYRSLYSLQLCNNEHIMQSLVPSKVDESGNKVRDPIFGLGWEPQDITVKYPDGYVLELPGLENKYYDSSSGEFKDFDNLHIHYYNLRHDRDLEKQAGSEVWTIEDVSAQEDGARVDHAIVGVARVGVSGVSMNSSIVNPFPAVNPIMSVPGDAISLNTENSQYLVATDDGAYPIDHQAGIEHQPEDSEDIRKKSDSDIREARSDDNTDP